MILQSKDDWKKSHRSGRVLSSPKSSSEEGGRCEDMGKLLGGGLRQAGPQGQNQDSETAAESEGPKSKTETLVATV